MLNHLGYKMPAVYLNHFYIVIDSATYLDIEQSAFMHNEFAANELRTTVRKDMSYTGLYFYGMNTYFEFFDASNPLVANQFTCDGVAFGVDEDGALQTIEKKLAPDVILEDVSVTRQYNDKQIPWFYSARLKDSPLDSELAIWLMEYHPHFLDEWEPQSKSQNLGVSRKQILQRYTSVLKDVPLRPFFKDVVALTIAVDEPTRKKLTGLATLLGFRELTSYGATNLMGTDIELHLIPPTGEKKGVQEIMMRVKGKPKKQAEFRFGQKSTLRFHGDKLATWSF